MAEKSSGAMERRILRINGYFDVPAEDIDDFVGKFFYWLESQNVGFACHARDGLIREVTLDEVEIDLGPNTER